MSLLRELENKSSIKKGKEMLKTSLKIVSFSLAIAVVSGCSNSESNESQTKIQVKTPYSWLEGDWKGDLSVHAMEESFPAELKYSNGKLELFAKEYCNGKAEFLSMPDMGGVNIQCGKEIFNVSPANKSGEIYNINNIEHTLINAIYIQHELERIKEKIKEKTKFAGFLGKE